jgi:hypothetical protein
MHDQYITGVCGSRVRDEAAADAARYRKDLPASDSRMGVDQEMHDNITVMKVSHMQEKLR